MKRFFLISSLIIIGVIIMFFSKYAFNNSSNLGDSSSTSQKKQETLYKNVDVGEFSNLINTGNVKIIDVRTEEEYNEFHIKGADLISLDKFDKTLDSLDLSKDKKILVYCHSGNRSRTAASSLIIRGYSEVYNLMGGIVSWAELDFPVETNK